MAGAPVRKDVQDRSEVLRAESRALFELADRLSRAGLGGVAGPLRMAASYVQSATHALETVAPLVPLEAPKEEATQ